MVDNSLHFETESVTLVVGANKAKLHVPRGRLNQIPYFAQALIAHGESDSQESDLTFSEFDHEVLSDVFEFFWRGAVSHFNYSEDGVDEYEVARITDARVAAYVVAHQLVLHEMQKKIENQIVRFHQVHHADPDQLVTLHEAGLRDSFLYRFLVAELSYDFAMKDEKALTYPGRMEACARMPKEMLLDLLVATGQHITKENRPSQQPFWLGESTDGSNDNTV